MSFRCQICNEQQDRGVDAIKVVTKVRQVQYPAVVDAFGRIQRVPFGNEIVEELKVCAKCAAYVKEAEVVGTKIA